MDLEVTSQPKRKGRPPSCVFCKTRQSDELQLGKMYHMDDVTVHYYCMLFSSGLQQMGSEDDEGILGFLPEDINKEVTRGLRLKCSYCRKPGATIGCNIKTCRTTYHLPCGLKHESLQQFFGIFPSYCGRHRPRQKAFMKNRGDIPTKRTCPICLVPTDFKPSINTICSPCCKNAWFHRICVQKQAHSAGYFFFKCALCNNKEIFQQEMLMCGIHIPEQDAAWELEQNAYEDLLYRHNRCDASWCLCHKGRKYNLDNSRWEIILCDTCGSQGCHIACGELDTDNSKWQCPECMIISCKAQHHWACTKSIISKQPHDDTVRLWLYFC